jgi:hypothetical protein
VCGMETLETMNRNARGTTGSEKDLEGEGKVMWLNVSKIDARIQKLQEIRKLAADPEMLALLQEFLTPEMKVSEPVASEFVERSEPKNIPVVDTPVEAKDVPVDGDLQVSGGSSIWGVRRH